MLGKNKKEEHRTCDNCVCYGYCEWDCGDCVCSTCEEQKKNDLCLKNKYKTVEEIQAEKVKGCGYNEDGSYGGV